MGPWPSLYRQIFIWHVSFHDPVYKVFTGAYDAWTHFNVVSQGQNLLERTFPLHMTLNSDIYCPVQRACSPSATEQAGKMLWKIVQFATRAVSYGGKSSLPSNVLHPSLRISIDSEDCLLYMAVHMLQLLATMGKRFTKSDVWHIKCRTSEVLVYNPQNAILIGCFALMDTLFVVF